jgi:hypothetical protein
MLLVVPTSIAAGQKSLLADPGSGPPPPVTPDPVAGPDPQIHMAYFSKVGCSVCDEVEGHLDEAQRLYPQLVVTEFPIEDESSKVLSEWLGQRFGVPEEKRMTTPSVFVGQHYLVGTDQVVPKNLQAVLDRYVDSGTEPTWTTYDSARSEASIFARFRSFGAFTVAGAGLIDGLNPCAFATIVFFVSYLAFLDRKGREVLAVGGAFALGVFVTYLLVGLGMLRVLEQLAFLSATGDPFTFKPSSISSS